MKYFVSYQFEGFLCRLKYDPNEKKRISNVHEYPLHVAFVVFGIENVKIEGKMLYIKDTMHISSNK